jgi:anti-sigma B factor antagonist
MQAELSITSGFQDGYRVLVVEGELDMVNADRLDDALQACTDGIPLVVDLSSVTFIESTGLHVLLKEREGGRPSAIIRAPASNVARVLEIVEAGKAIPLYDDLAAAVEEPRPVEKAVQ